MTDRKAQDISTQPYRGTKDQFPEDQRVINHIFAIWRDTARHFGYEEYAGPILEPIELYLSKTSEEIVNEQLYHVYDKGERHLAIRPEMTPTLARMVASRAKQLVRPIRWFSIATCMRFERPQRSRLRQFDQFNLDVLGGDAHDEDVEVLLTILYTMTRLRATPVDYAIKINHRELVNDFLAILAIDKSIISPLLRLMDAVDKIPIEKFMTDCQDMGVSQDQAKKIMQFMRSDLTSAEALVGAGNQHLSYLKKVIGELKAAAPDYAEVFRFAPGVMRGFDYYTGMVFEVFDNHPENHRALFGGGRYDDLVSSFGGEKLSGVGYGVSEISLINFMKTHDLLPNLERPIDVLAFAMDENAKPAVTALAMELRLKGLLVEQAMGAKKIGKLFAHADKIGAKACVFIGSDELSAETFAVKWLATKEQLAMPSSAVDKFVADFNDKNLR